jgi:hypothetical protein
MIADRAAVLASLLVGDSMMTKLMFYAALSAGLFAQESAPEWSNFDFLLGKWIGVAGEKDTPLGAGQGGFSFEADLNKKVIVRRNHAEYDKGATHDDLMVIYTEGTAASNLFRAIYFDSEGHVIRYNVAFRSKDSVVFESDGSQPGPKYRLSYWMEPGGVMKGKFEVAAPGSTEFKSYLSWGSKRVAGN